MMPVWPKTLIITLDEVIMSETFISGLNSIIPEQGAQNSKGIGSFDLDATEAVEGVNSENQISDNNKFSLGSLIEDAVDAFSPVVQSIANSDINFNSDSVSNPLNAVKDFWSNQASNFYNIMNKDTVNDISELVSKL